MTAKLGKKIGCGKQKIKFFHGWGKGWEVVMGEKV